ncbi:MAG: EI24 domain-containing protein [Myxococcota bacterium]
MLAGPRVLRRAFTLLRTNPSLWPWAALPFLVSLLAFVLAIWAFVANLDAIAGPLERALDPGEPEAWWAWAWAGPLLLLAVLLRWLLLAALAVAIYFLFTVLGGVVAAPFLDVLSERVEAIVTGARARAGAGFGDVLRTALRSIVEESKRTLFFLGGQLAILLLGLIPGLQPVAAVASLVFSALFLPLDYTAYALDRRRVRFRARRRWIFAHRSEMLGFGGFGLALFFVPGLSFLCLPWLVTAGTLLVLELGAPE